MPVTSQLEQRDKQRKATQPEWSTTCGHTNDGAAESGTACSLPLLAAGHGKPLNCVCNGDTETEQSFRKQAVQRGGTRGGGNKMLTDIKQPATEDKKTLRAEFIRIPWEMMHWEVTQDFYLLHSLVLSVVSHSFSAVTLGLPECCLYYTHVPKSEKSKIYELVSKYTKQF